MPIHERERAQDRPAEAPAFDVHAGWLARATVSGFAASTSMLCAFLVAFGLAWLLGQVTFELSGGVVSRDEAGNRYVRPADTPPLATPGGDAVHQWLYNLTHNRLIDGAVADVYGAAAMYLVGGIGWALLYALLAEPRLSGPPWRRGMLFALLPAAFSLLVFLPLTGAGPFGLALGAGPLPTIGNIALHLVYGAILGTVYGPLSDRDATTLRVRTSARDAATRHLADRTMSRGLVFGVLIGAALGLAGTSLDVVRMEAVPAAGFLLASALLGGALGVSTGAVLSLPDGGRSPR